MNVSGSVVLYKAGAEDVCALLDCVKNQSISVNFVVVDNSPTSELCEIVQSYGYFYLHLPSNPGFGSAHNLAFRHCHDSHFHFVVNPDVHFERNCFELMAQYLDAHQDVVCAVPKVIYPDGRLQRLCKLLPTPLNLFARRFLPRLADHLDVKFEMQCFGYDAVAEIPYVSGCFMALRQTTVQAVGGFDENFFMYLEDTDLSRRLTGKGKVVFLPFVVIIHEFSKASYRNWKLLAAHISSAVYYFNKWGWFFDAERRRVNREAMIRLRKGAKSLKRIERKP